METGLRQAPVTYLSPGMTVPGDIYGADAKHLMVPAGTVLSAAQIEKIKEVTWQNYVYVSEATYQDLSDNIARQTPLITASPELERETGYTGMKEGTDGLLKKIAATGLVPKEEIYTVSDELAHRLHITKTDVIFEIINGLAAADEYLPRHVVNVGMLNGLMGRWLGLPQQEIDSLILIGLLHDCGKAVVPPGILNAPRRLLGIEFEVMKMHTVYGYKLLTEFPAPIRDGVLYHHEKAGGKGYPKGRHGDDIPLSARITSVSDIYDAMVSRRVYKEPSTPFSVLEAISGLRGTALDAQLADTFLANMPGVLKGKRVLLSNGETGTVKKVDPQEFRHPLVELDGALVKCDESLYCVAMR
jgi:HD-GYP domain-containing protein (c-di-GMP phosphodiesterase class II)